MSSSKVLLYCSWFIGFLPWVILISLSISGCVSPEGKTGSAQSFSDECMLQCLDIQCDGCCSLTFMNCQYYTEDETIFNGLVQKCFKICFDEAGK